MATYNGHNEDASGNILLSIGNGMTATVETGTTASQAYTKGQYLYYNNRLCKVTAAIAKSATLTIGTNIAYSSLGAELTSHLVASNGNEFYFDLKDGKAGYYPTSAKTASTFVPFGGSGISSVTILTSGYKMSASALTYTATQNCYVLCSLFAWFNPSGSGASDTVIGTIAVASGATTLIDSTLPSSGNAKLRLGLISMPANSTLTLTPKVSSATYKGCGGAYVAFTIG